MFKVEEIYWNPTVSDRKLTQLSHNGNFVTVCNCPDAYTKAIEKYHKVKMAYKDKNKMLRFAETKIDTEGLCIYCEHDTLKSEFDTDRFIQDTKKKVNQCLRMNLAVKIAE